MQRLQSRPILRMPATTDRCLHESQDRVEEQRSGRSVGALGRPVIGWQADRRRGIIPVVLCGCEPTLPTCGESVCRFSRGDGSDCEPT